MNPRASKGIENEDDRERDARQNDIPAERLIYGIVQHLACYVRILAPNFAEAVENDDRIVHGITENCQERCYNRQADLEFLDAEKAERADDPVTQGDAREHHKRVVG